MLAAADDGRLQVTAAVSLLENSRLLAWSPSTAQFNPQARDVFEQSWQRDIDPVFGRQICWISFAAGAEFLAKGVCLQREVEIRKEKELPICPSGLIQHWASNFQKNWRAGGTTTTTVFGTLGDLTGKGPNAPLSRLCTESGATTDQRELLLSAYELLGRTIRNRDVHAYLPNVRDLHHSVVSEVFCPCFNLLVSWLPDGPAILNVWRAEAASFISQL